MSGGKTVSYHKVEVALGIESEKERSLKEFEWLL